MKPDIYTRVVLTVIALMLTVIAFNQYANPKITAQAQGGAFAGVQAIDSNSFFDTRTGEVWSYFQDDAGTMHPNYKHQLGKLGAAAAPRIFANK
jgi:hypothetical protein